MCPASASCPVRHVPSCHATSRHYWTVTCMPCLAEPQLFPDTHSFPKSHGLWRNRPPQPRTRGGLDWSLSNSNSSPAQKERLIQKWACDSVWANEMQRKVCVCVAFWEILCWESWGASLCPAVGNEDPGSSLKLELLLMLQHRHASRTSPSCSIHLARSPCPLDFLSVSLRIFPLFKLDFILTQ